MLLSSLFRRTTGRHAKPRMLSPRQAKRAARRLAEATTALPTVVERDRAATLAHVRAHWRIEDADTGVMPVNRGELVRPYTQADAL